MIGARDVKKIYEGIEFLKSQVIEIKRDIKNIKEELEFSPSKVRKFEEKMDRAKFKTFSGVAELRKTIER